MKIQNDGWSWRRVPRRCIRSASPELARTASRRRGLIIHAVMDSEAEIRGQTTLPPATVAAGRHPDAQGVRGTYARGGDEIGPVGKQLYWTYAAKSGAQGEGRAEHPAPTRWEGRAEHPAASRAAWGEGRGAGIPLPPRRRHVKNLRVHLQPAWHFAALLQQTTLAPEWSVTHRPPGRAPSVRWVCILRWCV